MYYEDQARRFNLLSGFLFGALVGTLVGLLAAPARAWAGQRGRRRPRRLR
jgi:gas vesicle protein